MSEILTKPLMGVFKSGKWVSIPDVSITKNGIDEIVLRGWQSEILELRKQSKLPHLFINCPTGAGKSKAALAIVTHTEKDSDKLVIISAPQKEIGKGFLSSSGDPQKILDHIWLINPSNQLCENSYRNEDGNIARLLEFIKNPRISDLNERVLVCCHATLSLLFDRLSAYEKTKYLKNIKLCIDESHHSLSQDDTGNGLGKVVNYFLKHSVNDLDLVMMTATPFRGDKGSLIPEKYLNQFCRYDLDYGRHFEENCSGLEFTYNAVLHQYGDSYGIVIEQLMNKYLNRGDKVLVQIPPSNKSISNGKFNDLQMVYDAIGTDQSVDNDGVVHIKRGESVVKVIDLITEKNREDRLDYLRNNHHGIDVVIGISMIKEGFDWPPANAGILIGSQGSLNAQIQLMGRMFRAYGNKGKDNGQNPVEISQIFPYVDHEKLDEDETREQINTFMKIVYAALAMELVINPIHIDIPLKVESGESGPRKSVKNFLTENLTDTQYTELLSTVMDEFRDWKATAGEDESNSEKISEIVSRKLTELGVDENHKEVAEFFNKSLQRSAKFQMMAMEGIDVSHIDIDLMGDIEDPIDSILMGMSNGLCGASDIKEFQLLMKPVDTLRRCYELKEWVEKNGKFPSRYSENQYERSLYTFMTQMRASINSSSSSQYKIDSRHITILESIDGWNSILFGSDDFWKISFDKYTTVKDDGVIFLTTDESIGWKNNQKTYYRKGNLNEYRVSLLNQLTNWVWSDDEIWDNNYNELIKHDCVSNGFPKRGSVLGNWVQNQRSRYKKGKLQQEKIDKLEMLDFWLWDFDDEWYVQYDKHRSLIVNGKYPSKEESNSSLMWFSRQRKLYNTNKLSSDKIKLLEQLPNWYWGLDEKWEEKYNEYLNSSETISKDLEKWISRQRSNYKKGKLSPDRIKKLENHPSWNWDLKTDIKIKTIQRANMVVEIYNKFGRLPSHSKNFPKEEHKLAGFYNDRKLAKLGKRDYTITEEEDLIFSVLPDWPK